MRNSTDTIEHMKLVVTEMDGDAKKPQFNANEIPQKKTVLILDDLAKNKDAFQAVTRLQPRRNPVLAMASTSLRDSMIKTTLYPFFASTHHMRNSPPDARRAAMLDALEAKCAQHTLDSIEISNFPLDDIRQVGPRGAPRLAAVIRQCTDLRSLTLVDTGVQRWSEIARALPFCPQLERVDFSCNRLVTTGNTYPLLCISLHRHDKLSDIDFSECDLSGKSSFLATACSRCPALTKLNVSRNNLGDDDRNSLINLLPACHNLQHLNLSFNGLQTNAHAQSLGNALRSCPSLTHLDLSRNLFQSFDIPHIAQGLVQCRTLRHLSLRGCIYLRARGLCAVAASGVFRPLTSLDLSNCGLNFPDPAGVQTWPTTPATLAQLHTDLSQCTNLTRLTLARNRLGDCFLDGFVTTVLPACRALTHLDLEETEIRNAGLRRLTKLVPQIPNLVDLNILQNNFTEDTRYDMHRAWVRTHAHAHGLRMDP